MAIADLDALLEQTQPLMGTAWELVTAAGREQAAQQALDELGWGLPVTDNRQGYWSIERTKRQMLYILLIQHAERFRYKQIHLQQRFDNYLRLITQADELFAKAIEDDLSGLFPLDMDLDQFAKYGFLQIPAGFVYDQLGRDLTYVD